MKMAKGSVSWIMVCLFFDIIFFVLFLFFYASNLGFVFLLFSLVCFLLLCLFLLFFRDPDRETGKGFVAVADGRIREITELNDEDIGKCVRVSTFMNVHNVHVNRMPIDGLVLDLVHHSGFHLPAFRKESEKNERVILVVNSKIGRLKIVLIAGTLARRIVPYIKKGDSLKKGARIGIIRFGSRVDVYIPRGKIDICVNVGDTVIAGVDTIGTIND